MRTHSSFRRRGSIWLQGILLLLIALGASTPIHAATVRGQLVRIDKKGVHQPAAGIEVTVSSGSSGHRVSKAYTNSQGMYYVYNVQPGEDTLEIRISQTKSQKYQIRVSDPSTDIKPIVVP